MMLFSLDLQVYNVARNDVRYENYQIIDLRDGFSFGSHIRNFHLFQQGKFFSLSCHFYTSIINSTAKIGIFP